jgi:hypothetical protein
MRFLSFRGGGPRFCSELSEVKGTGEKRWEKKKKKKKNGVFLGGGWVVFGLVF